MTASLGGQRRADDTASDWITGSRAQAALRELARTFRDDPGWIPGEAAAIADAIHAELPQLGADDGLRAMTYTTSEAVIRLALEILIGEIAAEEIDPPPAAQAYARELARRDISVDTLPRAYHIGVRTWFERWADTVRGTIDDSVQASLALEGGASWSMAFVSMLSGALVAHYSEERERWLRGATAIRVETVQSLLAGEPADRQTSEARLGYALDRNHLGLVVWSQPAEDLGADPGALERAAADLAGALSASRPVLIPLGGTVVAAWVGSRNPLDVEAIGGEVGQRACAAVGTPGAGLEGFRRSHFEAMHARRVAQLGGAPPGSVTRYEEVALVALASADLRLARDFVATELGALALPDERCQTLAVTVRAYLEEGSSPRRAARRLGVHENTVKNRVKAAADALGRPIESRAPELLTALRLAPLL